MPCGSRGNKSCGQAQGGHLPQAPPQCEVWLGTCQPPAVHLTMGTRLTKLLQEHALLSGANTQAR